MFEKMKAGAALMGLLSKRGEIQAAIARVKEKMGETTVTGSGGGGAVRAVVSGQLKVVSIEMSPGLCAGISMDDKTRSLAGSLIAEAVNDGMAKAQAVLKDAISAEAKALGLPDLGGLEGLAS